MKQEVKKILKNERILSVFTEDRYKAVYELMKYAMKQDPWLKNYLSLDPLNKAQWIADQLIILVGSRSIK